MKTGESESDREKAGSSSQTRKSRIRLKETARHLQRGHAGRSCAPEAPVASQKSPAGRRTDAGPAVIVGRGESRHHPPSPNPVCLFRAADFAARSVAVGAGGACRFVRRRQDSACDLGTWIACEAVSIWASPNGNLGPKPCTQMEMKLQARRALPGQEFQISHAATGAGATVEHQMGSAE